MADDIQVKREKMPVRCKTRKEGHARGFTVYSDEAERTGGDNSRFGQFLHWQRSPASNRMTRFHVSKT